MAYPMTPFGMNSIDLYGCDYFSAYPMMGMMNQMGMMKEYSNMFPMPGAYGKWDYTQFEKKYQEQNIENMTRQDAIMNLHTFAINDEQDRFKVAYQNALKLEKERLAKIMPNASAAKLEAAARSSINNTYQQMTGKPLTQVLHENGDNPIWQGIKDAFCLGLNDRTKYEDNLEMVSGTNKSTPGSTVGRTVGGALGGAAIGAGIGACFGGVMAVPGAIIGGAIGGTVSFLKGLFS